MEEEKYSINNASFPKLNSNNYNRWKVDMKVLLMDRGSWEFIIGEAVPPEEDAKETRKHDYKRRKDKAYTTIYQGIERQFQTLIANTIDGKEAWDILKENFEPTSRARLAGLIDEFYDLKFNTNEETIGIFCRRVNEKKLLIKEAGFELPEILTCFQLIRKLPADYDNLVQMLYRLGDDEFQFNKIEKHLITEDGRIQQKRKDEGIDITIDAYTTGTNKGNKNSRKEEHNKNQQTGSGSMLRLKGKQSTQRSENRKDLYCRYCKKQGHKLEDCYSLKRAEQNPNENRNKSNKPRRAFYSEDLEESDKNTQHEVQMTDSIYGNLDEWLIDSAATSHFCKERDWFQNFKNLPPTDILIGDKDAKSQVLGKGDVIFHVKDKDRFVEIKLLNVLYAPNMRRNLISGACMDIAGLSIEWKNDRMVIYTDINEYYFTVERKGKLYVVHGLPDNRRDEAYNASKYNKNLDMELLHRRFCHANAIMINHMSKQNVVKGIEKCNENMNTCNICRLTKITRASFKPIKEIKSTEILERVYMDIWGPSPVESLGGSRYFLSIIDEYSRKVFVYTLRKKSEVFMYFKEFLAEVEKQHSTKLKIVRTDNGLEFCNLEFERFLKQRGIKIERTSTYTPEQNGVAERFNRTAIEGVRAMLRDSGLKLNFWAEALHMLVHVKNRSEHRLLKDCTPNERWSGYKPSVQHFRVFGALAYAYIPRSKRNKLQAKANIGVLVGYAAKTKGYRVWLPKEKRVMETIHVKIEEEKNGVETLFGRGKSTDYFKMTMNEDPEMPSEDEEPEKPTEKGLTPIDITKWNKIERPRTRGARIDVYYYPPGENTRLRSNNEVIKYCNDNKLEYKPQYFTFKAKEGEEEDDKEEEDKKEIEDENNLCKGEKEDTYDDLLQGEVYATEVPRSFEESQNHPETEKWNMAMKEELKVMEERKVWKLVDLPQNSKVIGNRWVFTVKKDDKNNVKRYKARLVAQGFGQKYGVNYIDIFSPVVSFSVVRFFFIFFVSTLSWYHVQLDVRSAYLYGKLNDEIYMRQPAGFEIKGQEEKVCLLRKTIYGLHQSGREWNNEFDVIIKTMGFEKLSWCNCVYKLNNQAILLLYVDDIVLIAKSEKLMKDIVKVMKTKIDIQELGEVKYLLGVNFEKNRNEYYLHQRTYIEKLQIKFKELPETNVSLPLKVGSLPPKEEKGEIIENELMKKFPYKSLIGCLSFIADRSRPDISFAVNTMSQFCNSYSYEHWTIVVDIMNYVFNTKEYKINLSTIKETGLIAYSDANWGCNLMNRHSTSGYVIFFNDIPFTWKSNKQKCIALSSMESEFVALTESVKELVWFSNILSEFSFVRDKSTPIQYCDNQSAIYFCKNSIENMKTKHIDIKLQFIRNWIKDEKFKLMFIRSGANLADFLTKPLLKLKLSYFLKRIFEKTEDVNDCGAEC